MTQTSYFQSSAGVSGNESDWSTKLQLDESRNDVDLDQPHVMSLRVDKMGAVSPLALVSTI